MQQKQDSLINNLIMAGKATLLLHPVRVAMNKASKKDITFWGTIEAVKRDFFKGGFFNVIRGAFNTGLQSQAKLTAQQNIPNTTIGQMAGLMAATGSGTVVSMVAELPFMRANEGAAYNLKLFKANKALAQLFMTREFGFSGAVLLSKDFSTPVHYTILFCAAWLTAACHKLVTLEATKEHLQEYKNKTHSFPDYSKGMKQALMNMSQGHYTYLKNPSIAKPHSFFQKTINVMEITCTPNLFFWRLVYLKGFTELLAIFKKQLEADRQEQPPKIEARI